MSSDQKSAAVIAIGDELLSGRTRDANLHYLAGWLTARGINLREARVIPDEHETIMRTVNELRARTDYLFTSGGIGPTHDDITADAIAAAFDLPIEENTEAITVMQEYYTGRGEALNPGRHRMARMPKGATLVHNEVNGPPGFQIGNVFVLAGVPAIFRSMLTDIDARLSHGPVSKAYTVKGPAIESALSEGLGILQSRNPDVSIGSYPGKSGRRGTLSVVSRGLDELKVRGVALEIVALMNEKGYQATLEEGDGGTE